MECKRGTGAFQWNTGAWFGSQIGSTCWMLACGLWLLGESPLMGTLLLGYFAAANAIGTAIWAKRDRIDPYRAIQVLLLVVLVFTALALVSSDCLGFLGKLDERLENPRLAYLLLLLFPVLMIVLRLQNGPKSGGAGTDS